MGNHYRIKVDFSDLPSIVGQEIVIVKDDDKQERQTKLISSKEDGTVYGFDGRRYIQINTNKPQEGLTVYKFNTDI